MEPRDGWRGILRAFENQRQYCRGYSPLYEALMDEAARGVMPLAADEGPWAEYAPFAEALGEAWEARHFATPVEPSLLVAALLHRAALTDAPEARPLRRFFPTVGGSYTPGDRAALRDAFLAFWRAPPPAALRFLREGRVQTNELSRAPAWLLPATAFHLWTGLPVDLVDLGSSAGITLAADRMAWRWETRDGTLALGDGHPVIAQTLAVDGGDAVPGMPLSGALPLPRVRRRVGVDLEPVDLRDPDARLCLRACVWGDQADRLRRLDDAIATFLALPREEAPVLLQADMAEGVLAAAPDAAATGPRVLLVLNTVSALYLTPAQYARLEEAVTERFAALPAGHLGAWVELETPRPGTPEAASDISHLRFSARLLDRGGALRRFPLGMTEPHPTEWRLDSPGWAALRDAVAAR